MNTRRWTRRSASTTSPSAPAAGEKQITAQTVDFSSQSDGPMSDENLAEAPGKILHIPTVAGADVITYNLPGNPKLKLDSDAIANLFLGNITKWNDPKIAALDPDVTLPICGWSRCIVPTAAAPPIFSPIT